MKYFEYLGQVLPGLRKGWLNPKNPHYKETPATNTEPVADSTASPVTQAKATTATNAVTAATSVATRPFKKVLE
jgi:hypothetical protein